MLLVQLLVLQSMFVVFVKF